MKKPMILFSGGMDSTFMLHTVIKAQSAEVVCLSFNYGQPHADKELTAAKAITDKLGVEHLFEKLDFPFLRQDMAGDNPVVPNRNMIFLAVAGAIAEVHGCGLIYIGCTQSDFETFPDCRPNFLRSIGDAMVLSNNIHVIAPLVGMSKKSIVRCGQAFDIDWGDTWSCYAGGDEPCGECMACKERDAVL